MSAPTVALVGPTGTVGSALAAALAPLAEQGKIKLVLAHRALTDVSKLPAASERRVIDLEAGPEATAKVLAGVDVVISALHAGHEQLARALAHVPSLKAYIPSDFGTVWTDAQIANPSLPVKAKYDAVALAQQAGVPVVEVKTGLFEPYAFGSPIVHIETKANKLALYKDALHQPFPVSSLPYIAAGIAHLVTQPLSTVAPGHYSLVERFVTGAEIVAALEAAHGAKPAVRDIPAAEVQAATAMPGVLAYGLIENWGEGFFAHAYEDAGIKAVEVPGYTKRSLEEVVKSYA